MTTRLLAAAVLALALAGCGGAGGTAPPERPPEYVGILEERDEGRGILVRDEGDACGIWTTPEEGARAFRALGGGEYEEIAWDELPSGATIELWIPGPVAESCPMQGAAEAAAVTDAP